jgi:secreted PhoX family phosphatase
LSDNGPGRWIVCVNHETPLPELMFPGWADARRSQTRHAFVAAHVECVPVMQASVGVSVVELEYEDGWRYRRRSRLNRRITASTPMELAGPGKDHPLLSGPVFGTFANCAAGMTPWGTYLTAEENVDDFFGNRENAVLEPELERVYARFGARARESLYRWEFADRRFDTAHTPREPLKFGWIVEIDPRDAARPIKKRTALGRFQHEGATTVLSGDGRAVVYMGDDDGFEYFYKFVTRGRFDPERPAANRDLLDSLEHDRVEVQIAPDVRQKAQAAIDRMLTIQ